MKEFTGDPQASYLLIVQDDGEKTTGAEIKLNGEIIVPKTTLTGAAVAEFRQSVMLKSANRLTVLPLGRAGAKVTVWILAGTREIDQAGGIVRAPGGATMTIPPQAIVGRVRIQLAESLNASTHFPPIAGGGVLLALSVLDPNTQFSTSESLVLSARLTNRTVNPALLAMRAELSTLPGTDLWGPASLDPTGTMALAKLPASGFDQLATVFRVDTLRLLLVPEVLPPEATGQSVAGLEASIMPGFLSATPGVSCTNYPAGPSGWTPASGPLRRFAQSKAPTSADVAIVLVHGFSPLDVDCASFSKSTYLPGENYFANLLGPLESKFDQTNPIYAYTYPTFNHFKYAGDALTSDLHALLTTVRGVVLVAHSMGGLVAHQAATNLESDPTYKGKVLGIVAIGVPFYGTPLAGPGLILKWLAPSTPSAGMSSLALGLLPAANEPVPIRAHAGNVFLRFPPYPKGVGGVWVLGALSTVMCSANVLWCANDGLVPLFSAQGRVLPLLPSFISKGLVQPTWNDFDHDELEQGFLYKGAFDSRSAPLYIAIENDISALAAAAKIPTGVWTGTTDENDPSLGHPASYALSLDFSAVPITIANAACVNSGTLTVDAATSTITAVYPGCGTQVMHYQVQSGFLRATGTLTAQFGGRRIPTTWAIRQSGSQTSALHLDGSSGYVTVPVSGSSVFDVQRTTVEAWFKLASNVGFSQARIINRQSSQGGGESWGVEVFGAGYGGNTVAGNVLNFHSGNCTNNLSVTGATALQPGTWYHVAAENDGTTLRIYLNGQFEASVASLGTMCAQPGTPVTIGKTGPNSQFYFPGDIDDVRIWDGARSQTEIQQNMRTRLTGFESGLVGYWRFDEGVGATAFDATVQGNSGTLQTGASWVTQSW
ncbi:MAG: alpha/beta fold hydrolase [Gemmatimonadota bacterium]